VPVAGTLAARAGRRGSRDAHRTLIAALMRPLAAWACVGDCTRGHRRRRARRARRRVASAPQSLSLNFNFNGNFNVGLVPGRNLKADVGPGRPPHH
jgi:hypothetical protein